jgi:glycosyltransferase domain-containing protein
MIDQFSLVITTYNRYPYLLRLLKYYRSFNFPFQIHILDSSSEEINSHELLEILDNTRIKYERFDPDIFISQKIGRGIEIVKTPFVGLCADDDFVIPSGINTCIDFLKENNDYSVASGKYLAHWVPSYSKSANWIPIYLKDSDQCNDNPISRVKSHFLSYYSTFYAVHKTEVLKNAWQSAAKFTTDFGLSEILPSAISVLYGKKKVLDVVYSSREMHDSSWFEQDYIKFLYSKEKMNLASLGLAEHIKIVLGNSSEESYKLAEECLYAYTNKQIDLLNDEKKNQIKNLIKKLLRFLKLSSIPQTYTKRKHFYDLRKDKDLFIRGHSNVINEMSKISQVILYSNENKTLLNKSRANYKKSFN